MINKEYDLGKNICDIGKNLWKLGFVAANDGNISVKLGGGLFLTTPTGVSKNEMTPEMLVVVDENNEVIRSESGLRPSTEFLMHLRCYKERDDIGAVVHAHPPTATGFAVARKPLDNYAMSEAVMFLGSVPVAPFSVPGSESVPESIAPFLADHDVILLANHGAITVGTDLRQAYFRMETLEHYAKVSLTAHLLGGAVEIERDSLDECIRLSENYSVRHPGYKKYSL